MCFHLNILTLPFFSFCLSIFIASFFQLGVTNFLYHGKGYDIKKNLLALKEKDFVRQFFALSIAQLSGIPILLIFYVIGGSILSFYCTVNVKTYASPAFSLRLVELLITFLYITSISTAYKRLFHTVSWRFIFLYASAYSALELIASHILFHF